MRQLTEKHVRQCEYCNLVKHMTSTGLIESRKPESSLIIFYRQIPLRQLVSQRIRKNLVKEILSTLSVKTKYQMKYSL